MPDDHISNLQMFHIKLIRFAKFIALAQKENKNKSLDMLRFPSFIAAVDIILYHLILMKSSGY